MKPRSKHRKHYLYPAAHVSSFVTSSLNSRSAGTSGASLPINAVVTGLTFFLFGKGNVILYIVTAIGSQNYPFFGFFHLRRGFLEKTSVRMGVLLLKICLTDDIRQAVTACQQSLDNFFHAIISLTVKDAVIVIWVSIMF